MEDHKFCNKVLTSCCKNCVVSTYGRSLSSRSAIHNVVHAIILHQQQKQQQQPSSQVSFQQPQQQYPLGQGSFRPSQQNPQAQGSVQPQQLPQFEEIRNQALQTLPAMCNVYIPPYCTIAPFGIFGTN
ncbi:unnamed protein product [Triticum turgidum subsp. durum]|uniref:Uncharacterized protein n=1 Tax=Triticum turgidum subsp. durum TaxID=4567 RepID=A0A9R0XSN0_TRITD|nr:unnamed protein product [Triticum turgidum subsp. durum]